MKKQLAALLLGMFALNAAHAEESKPVYDRVAFSVNAAKEVPNDVLSAVLYAEQQGQDTVAMADAVNQAITWAMAIAKQESAVESRTLNYTTNPVYADGRISGWQVRQSIQLKSKDSKVLSGLLGKLQEKLRIEGINYSVSPEMQAETEKALIDQALKNFKDRAEQLKTGMGRAEYRVVRLDVQSVGNDFPQPMYRMAAMEAAGAPAPPSLEGGKQNLQVNVQAEIELSIN
ncbi:MAG TPA: SIMPL domain-containing protein [Candidatus Thiothrix moscowensis]|uniref:SIMPL domain-containing protein n=1 Tax=unclassified Thiothrix TaxID=2636184 RepID=UPI001A1D7B7D|nr:MULTISPECIES: SIMPL domain-containing protein [unclassified Thiothrix]MBJ6610502.1 SIMPL domain-containing protein [Candidatus Thiothrix moscowensis]HRJ52739.1 SIMPL domain-containing protein [Candidatus Thiothrix moscowensis]HRJ92777.1 SIMPL domain-containing protein [Candidatus Thiothrix moscowensis]